MNFVKMDTTVKGNNTWYPLELSSEGVKKNSKFDPQGLAQCRFYDLKAEQYEMTTCYRSMIAAMCFIATGDVPNDLRCESTGAPKGSARTICSIREAPSFHGAYQTCLGLRGALLPVSSWPLTLRTEELKRTGLLHYWDSSAYKFLLNGSDVTFNVKYANSLDSTKMCTMIEPQHMQVNSADCNGLRFYVIQEEEEQVMEPMPKLSFPSDNRWAALAICFAVIIVLLLLFLITLWCLKILVLDFKTARKLIRNSCKHTYVPTET